MGRYVRDGQSWSIDRAGTTITLVNPDGTTTVEELPSQPIAATRFNILIDQHVRAGWRLVRAEADVPAPAPRLPPQPVVHDLRNVELERAIEADPEAREPYIMYGDWLQQHGDPRGELIALHAAMEDNPRDHKLKLMVDVFQDRHAAYLFGGVREHVKLRFGFTRRIRIAKGKLVEQLEAALALPSSRFVVEIAIVGKGAKSLVEATRVIARAPASLRRVTLGGQTSIASLGELVGRLPALRMFGFANIGFGQVYRRIAVKPRCIAELAGAPLSHLEELRLEIGGPGPTELMQLLGRRDLPALRSLSLLTDYDGDLVPMLAGAPIAAQLETLELGSLGPFGAPALTANIGAFPRLARLGVPRDLLAEQMSELAQRVPRVYNADDTRYFATAE